MVSLCFFVLLALAACGKKDAEFYAFSGATMGTTYSIKVVVEGLSEVPSAADIQQRVEERLVNINQAMSTYIPDSELSLLNQAPVGEAIRVSPELLEILLLSQTVSEKSAGSFDITLGPLVNLWGFGPEELTEKMPSEEKIAAAQARIGYRKLSITREGLVTKHAALSLSLSAVAKGWAVDALAELLLDDGLDNFMVEVGGELRIHGENPSGKPWTIGVENPSLFRSGPREAIASRDAAIATSGDYRNYREVDGQRFSHTIDPETGRPITHGLASVTVVSKTAAEADAYATAINVLGPEKGLAFAKKHGIAAYFIVRDGEQFTTLETESFKPYKVKL